jgi:hypothetical protein
VDGLVTGAAPSTKNNYRLARQLLPLGYATWTTRESLRQQKRCRGTTKVTTFARAECLNRGLRPSRTFDEVVFPCGSNASGTRESRPRRDRSVHLSQFTNRDFTMHTELKLVVTEDTEETEGHS